MGQRCLVRILPRALAAWLVLLSVTCTSVAAAGLPAWQMLVFEQRAFGVAARSQVEVGPHGGSEACWMLTAVSSVANNTETVSLVLDPDSGRALYRSRLSSGRDQRFKSYDYLAGHILRERREPDSPDGVPERWPVSSRREVAHPDSIGDLALTDAYALLLLAERFQSGAETGPEVAVHTDFNFYRVRMVRGDGPEISVDYGVSGEGRRVTGGRATRSVTLRVEALGAPQEEWDFSLLGLRGEITLLYDRESGLLLQLRGKAPRIGQSTIELRQVAFRESRA